MKLFHNIFLYIWGSNIRCYCCNRRLKKSINSLIDRYLSLYYSADILRCPKNHVEYAFDINSKKILYAVYRVDKYELTRDYNMYGFTPKDSIRVKTADWQYTFLPWFDIERLSQEELLKKIELYLLFS